MKDDYGYGLVSIDSRVTHLANTHAGQPCPACGDTLNPGSNPYFSVDPLAMPDGADCPDCGGTGNQTSQPPAGQIASTPCGLSVVTIDESPALNRICESCLGLVTLEGD